MAVEEQIGERQRGLLAPLAELQRLEVRNAARPGAELGAGPILIELHPAYLGRFLQHLLGVFRPAKQRQQIAEQPCLARLVQTRELSGPLRIVGWRRVLGHRSQAVIAPPRVRGVNHRRLYTLILSGAENLPRNRLRSGSPAGRYPVGNAEVST